MVLKNLFGGKSKNVNRSRKSTGGNPEWVLPAALILGQKLYHSSSKASLGNKRHKKSRKNRRSRKNKRTGRSRRR